MHEPDEYQAWQHEGDNTRPVDIPDLFNPNPNNEFFLPEGADLQSPHRLTIKLPPMAANGVGVGAPSLRRSTRRTTSLGTEGSFPSGSEYHESEKSMEVDGDADAEGEEEIPSPEVEYTTSSRGRKVAKRVYMESETEGEDPNIALDAMFADTTQPVKASQRFVADDDDGDDDDDDDIGPRRSRRRTSRLDNFIVSDEDHPNGNGRYSTRSRSKKPPPKAKASTSNGLLARTDSQKAARAARRTRRTAKNEEEEDGYVDEPHSPSSPDGEFDDAPHTSSDLEVEADAEGEGDADGAEGEQEGRPYALRQRAKINYAIPPPLEEMRPNPRGGTGGRGGRNGGGRNGGGRPGARRGPGWSATGAELGKWMGMPGNDSVCRRTSLMDCWAHYLTSCRIQTITQGRQGSLSEAFLVGEQAPLLVVGQAV